ncbi:MAG: ABC transporter permease [Deltaproteobacteria bacterium]|nr:ABC transporter permease [Deltaproteobacteria bacterium]
MVRSAAITILGVTLLVFLVLRVIPGDPVDLMLGESAAPASRAALRSKLELDLPLSRQLVHYARRLAHGDLGMSLTRGKPVTQLIGQTIPCTLLLAFSASAFANLLGIPAGVLAAYRPRRRVAKSIFAVSILASALPVFWLGPLLVIAFSLHWPWLPISAFGSWGGLILPTIAIGVGLAAHISQTTRAAVIEVLHSDFIRTARAKGNSEARVLFRHALPVASRPLLTVSALQFGHLLAGAVIAETVFDWPGLGKLAYDALMQRDYPTIQGTVLVVTLIYVGLNILTDLLLERPR